MLASWAGVVDHASYARHSGLAWWLGFVWHGLEETHAQFPFIAYGTDWLAFAHIMIALFFIGPWQDPVANAWVLEVGLACCAGVIPLALVCGHLRGIPLYWRLADCSFGVFGSLPLLYCLHLSGCMAKPGETSR